MTYKTMRYSSRYHELSHLISSRYFNILSSYIYIPDARKVLDTADMAFLLVNEEKMAELGGRYTCGIANADSRDLPFGIVEHSCARGDLAFGHEVGHILRAHHNREVKCDNGDNIYAYGILAQKSKVPSGDLHSIMA